MLVEDVMQPEVITISPKTSLPEAMRLVRQRGIRHLPVVDNGRLVGIVAQADIALGENEKKTGELLEAISEPSEGERT